MNKSFIKIGCDPELFAIDVNTQKPVSVHGMIPGDKLDPYDVPFGAIQVDGTAAEFNIKPASVRKDFLHNIRHVTTILETAIKAKNSNLILKAVPAVHFDVDYFNALPMSAKALGCEPDFNAYTGKPNPKPDQNSTMRTGSGHVHIQFLPDGAMVEDPFDEVHFQRCCSLVKELDQTLYEASGTWDTDTDRQKLYGKPGAFRPKKYGLEYRVLSNAWLKESWTQMYVFDSAYNTTRKWLDGFSLVDTIIKAGTHLSTKELLDLQDKNGIPSIRCYAPEGYIGYEHAA